MNGFTNMGLNTYNTPLVAPYQPAMPMNGYYQPQNVNNFPHYSITKVRGRNGADAFQMAPNSQTLLLDETDPIVWFVQTDGAGYKTITPYSVTPYQPTPPIDLNLLEARITSLEEKFNAKSNFGTNKQSRKNRNEQQQQSNEFAESAD